MGRSARSALPEPGPGEVLVRTLHSGVSRGTETLVFRGEVPKSQWDAMRAPHQDGDSRRRGEVRLPQRRCRRGRGPRRCSGGPCSACYPHQTAYVVPAESVVVVPDDVPARRAVLAGTVETALNAMWDLGPLVGDRVDGRRGGHGRLLRGPAAGPDPRGRGDAGRRRPDAGRGGGGPGCEVQPTRGRRRRTRRGRALQRDVVGAPARPRPAGSGGHRPRPELVRRPAGRSCGSVARSTPDGSASGPARSARWRRPDAARAPTPTGSRWRWRCCATRRSTCS